MDTSKQKLNKTEKDILNRIKDLNRKYFKFEKIKITKNKKKYIRKKYKYKDDN